MAKALVNNLAGEWDPAKYTDQYRENLLRIIQGKVKGKEVDARADRPKPRQAEVVDLMERLRRSLEQSGARQALAQDRRTRQDARRTPTKAPAWPERSRARLSSSRPANDRAAPHRIGGCSSRCWRRSTTRRSTIRELVYEPKYDGIRAIAEVAPDGAVRLWSRLGNEKTAQFPEIAAALAEWARRQKQPVVLDGEIVALDAKGEPTGFQQLQGRIHLGGRDPSGEPLARPPAPASPARVAFIAFDAAARRRRPTARRPLLERRAALERLFKAHRHRRSCASARWCAATAARCTSARSRSGWEGLIAKHADSLYKSGKRTPDWRKLKIVHEQEFVVGGWTEPRQTRAYFGALLLGVYEGERARLRRPHRHRVQRARAGARDEAAEAARNRRVPVHAGPQHQRAPALGRAASSSRRSSSPSGPRTRSCGIRSTSGCATTRSRARSCASEDAAVRRATVRRQRGRPTRSAEASSAAERRTRAERRTTRGGLANVARSAATRSRTRRRDGDARAARRRSGSRSPTCTRCSGRSRS